MQAKNYHFKQLFKFSISAISTLGLFLLAAIALAPAAQAGPVITNGSFETATLVTGDYFCSAGTAGGNCTQSNVTGWSSNCNASGACGTTGTVLSLIPAGTGGSGFNGGLGLGASVPNSPQGGNFVADDGDPKYAASIWQNVTGLTPGSTYYIQFWQAAAQQTGSTTPTTEQWQVTFAGTTKTSALMSNPGATSYQPWTLQTISFKVPTTSTGTETLTFLALGTPTGAPPVALLDGVSISATAPEPGTLLMAGLGVGGILIGGVFRRRTPNQKQ